MAERCDVLVVGGGPGGSSCARALHAAGLDVVVMDRSTFPRDKVCAGWITPPVLDALQIDLSDYAKGRTWQPITAFRTGLIGGGPVETDYGRTVSYGIRRCEFDDYLLRRSGARLVLGEAVREIERDGAEWVVNGRVRAPDAGGRRGPRLSGGAPAAGRRGGAGHPCAGGGGPRRLRGRRSGAGGVPELYFCDDLAGYGWVIRKGDHLNVGLGRDEPHDLPGHLQRFCEWLRATGRLPQCPTRFKGHAYRLYDAAMPVPVADGIVLVGDAAGLAYPQTGEGIRPAIEAGLLAADVIREASRDYRAERLMPYWARLQARLGRPGAGVAGLIPGFARRALGRAILRSPRLTRRVVLDGWFLQGS